MVVAAEAAKTVGSLTMSRSVIFRRFVNTSIRKSHSHLLATPSRRNYSNMDSANATQNGSQPAQSTWVGHRGAAGLDLRSEYRTEEKERKRIDIWP
ncbi:uncharacterized protein PgNI_04870 [Pyricularia grisea]|uniref:Uncharacterized protein n=1 Tax=Pyricularia grisea TaxID=148305 RepID=A0A6P8BA97_PYRGI|nr:uncharacterized protein PgNI_04870 [Pyricularia grisea]TLD12745.1 hypothetical protein PgNI_04870 [Pyricularia grisea]